MKKFFLKEETPIAEFNLLHEIHNEYVKSPWEIAACQISTPSGNFINKGGFNGTPSDLWLYKENTTGQQKRSFWRTSVGSKKSGFRVFIYDLRFINVNAINYKEVAELIGANVTEIGGLKYFTKPS